MKKFPHNPQYNRQFARIKDITWYPYIGKNFGKTDKRIMVYAHEIPYIKDDFEAEVKRTSSPTFFADVLDEYTYINEKWSAAFRNFLKGAVGLIENYNKNSPPEIIAKIDNFVSSIAYTNFIDGLVNGLSHINTSKTQEQIERSKRINLEILKIMGMTHCICWGKQVFGHVCGYSVKPIKEEKLEKGFSKTQITLDNNQIINVLKIFHPSMPSFRHLHKNTHKIFSDFL